ncbi:putative ribonuclease H-like domain-containing protein [Tanacetum coccineum]
MPPTPDLSFTGLDEFVNKPVVENRKSDEEVSKIVRKNDDAQLLKNGCQINLVPRAVLMKSGLISVNTARQVNTAHSKTTVNAARPMSYLSKTAHSTVKRPIHKNTAFKNSNIDQRVNTVSGKKINTAWPKAVVNVVKGNNINVVKASACWFWKPKTKVLDHGNPQMDLQDQGVIDSGCSRHMTGNMSYLTDYEEIDGGYVAFGGNPKGGKITGKCTIKTGNLDFENVYFVRELKFNLFSVSQMCDKKNSVLFNDTECIVLSPNFKLIDESQVLLRVPRKNNMYSVDLKNIVPKGGNLVRGLPSKLFENDQTCVTCQKGKQDRASFVTDDYSRFTWVFFLATKDETSGIHKSFITGIENVDHKVKCPVTILNTIDHLGKFNGKADEGFFVGYSLNSKAFRVFNSRTRILEENLHIMFSESTPNAAGTKASDNASQARKQTEPVKDYILLSLWTVDPPYSQDLKSSHNDGSKPSSDDGKKVDEDPRKEIECNDQEKEDNVNNTNNVNDAGTNEVNDVGGKTSIELLFDLNMPALEDYSIFDFSRDDEDDGVVADINNLDTTIQASLILTTRIHKDHPFNQVTGDLQSATQTRKMSKNLEEHGFVSTIQQRTNHKDLQNCLFACFLSQEEPKKVIYALKDPSWIEAMQEELLQFKLQEVWTLVDLPNGKMAIGSKWVFRNKNDERGIVIRNKARLVTQGYTQEEGIDYDEVFAPVARIEAIRLFLAYASFKDFMVYQMDVKSAFLYGKIEEEVYVCQLPGFEDPDFPDRMSSIGELIFFLGLQVKRKKDGIFISQDKYVEEILKKFRFTEVKTASTPMETPKPLLKDEDGEEVDVHMYRSMIGSLMYLTSSRPDIMFAVCACTRYQVNPKVSHLYAVKRIFRYLKGQPKLGLWYPKDYAFDLVAYTDSDYARASLDRKSTTGGCQFLGCRLISWQCKKQTVVSNSTTEAEKSKKSVKLMMEKLFKMELELMLAKTINEEEQLHALVDGKKIIITESFVRIDLQLADEEASHTKKIFGNMKRIDKGFSGIVTPLFPTMVVQNQSQMGEGSANLTDPHHTPTFIQPSPQPQKTQKHRKPKRKDTQIPQSSNPSDNVADEVVHKVLGDSLVRAATTASSLEAEQDNGNIDKTQSKATPNESSSLGTTLGGGPRGNTLRSDEDRLKLDELMALCTTLQNRVLDLEKTRPLNIMKLLVESSDDEESLGEDASKQGRIDAIDANEEITLVSAVGDKVSTASTATTVTKFNEEERLAREKAKKEQEANIALIETWNDIQAKIDVDHQLAERLQGQEQEETELVEGREKRAGTELIQESIKKQKVEDEKETAEIKKLMEIIPYEEEVPIDAIPLVVKSPSIVDWKIHKEGRKCYYQII